MATARIEKVSSRPTTARIPFGVQDPNHGRVDVLDAARPDEMDLDDRAFVARPLECGAHARPEAPADHGAVLGIGVNVRRNVVVGRELEALDDDLAGAHALAEQLNAAGEPKSGRSSKSRVPCSIQHIQPPQPLTARG
jgi:hypothetical protein